MSDHRSKSYEGTCHCGAVKFTAEISPPLEEQTVISCNCSICSTNGYLLIYPRDEHVTFHSGQDKLTNYTFGTGRMNHRFCPTCGTSVYAKSSDPNFFPGKMGLNVRTLKDVNLDELKVKNVDGKNKW